jgi:hypothetical protein
MGNAMKERKKEPLAFWVNSAENATQEADHLRVLDAEAHFLPAEEPCNCQCIELITEDLI